MEVCLTPRLLAAVSLIQPGWRTADVGTDHGYAAAWLIQQGISPHVIAADLRRGPLESAARTCRACGVGEKITLRLSDGLDRIRPEEVDAVLIAGMGGETIQWILQRGAWALQKHLILQPQSKEEELLAFLQENGCAAEPRLVREGRRYYLVYAAAPGESRGGLLEKLAARRDPLLAGFAASEAAKLRRAEAGARTGKNSAAEAERLRRKIEELEQWEREAAEYADSR